MPITNVEPAAAFDAAVECTTKRDAHELTSAQMTVEALLGEVVWKSSTEGFCPCPGRESHTHSNGKRDCMVYLDHVPTIHCVHSSCRKSVEQKTTELRNALRDHSTETVKRRLTPEEKKRLQAIRAKEQLRKRAESSRATVLKNWTWPYDRICNDSPVRLRNNVMEHWKLLIGRFPTDGAIWIGEVQDSGREDYAKHFRTKAAWLSESHAPAPYICPALFKEGSYSRSNANVIARPFLVVESDTLDKNQVGAVFRWLKEKVGLKLVAIVDTAGKSLHGWFQYPTAEDLEDLKVILPQLGCDPKLFTASQPVRLPGRAREDRGFQRLIYLADGGAR